MPPKKEKPEMEELFARLDHQDKTQEQILWLLKGNQELQIEGLIPAVKRVEADVQDMKAWRNELTLLKGKFDFKRLVASLVVASKFAAWVVGIGGGVFTVFAFLKSIFE